MSKPARVMITSPRTSKRCGKSSPRKLNGTLAIVRTLVVMFSPTLPSPRVAARTSFPSSYKILTAKPSSFGSQLKLISLVIFKRSLIRFSNANISSSSKALSRDNMGTSCSTCSNALSAAPPTFCEGESGLRKSGWAFSISSNSRIKRSYSASGTEGLSCT